MSETDEKNVEPDSKEGDMVFKPEETSKALKMLKEYGPNAGVAGAGIVLAAYSASQKPKDQRGRFLRYAGMIGGALLSVGSAVQLAYTKDLFSARSKVGLRSPVYGNVGIRSPVYRREQIAVANEE